MWKFFDSRSPIKGDYVLFREAPDTILVRIGTVNDDGDVEEQDSGFILTPVTGESQFIIIDDLDPQ